MFSYLFGSGSKSRKHAASPASDLPSSQHNHPNAAFPPPVPSTSRQSGDYDDIALDGGSKPPLSSSSSAAYPPVPSFSRPSYASSSHAARYPPLSATFARLTELLDAQSPALLDSLAPPLSPSDPVLASLRASLAPYQIPSAVLESYSIHDGQDSLSFAAGGGSIAGGSGGATGAGSGLFYGLWWMPLERVEEEWNFWKKLADAGGKDGLGARDPFSASVAPSSSAAEPARRGQDDGDDDEEGEEGMSSFPPGWVRRKYTHPGWLPLLTDRCGNYVGVDLDPPSPAAAHGQGQKSYGQAGQVIAFGREIDDKVVLFPGDGSGGWARFLAAFVEDVERGEFARLGERPVSSSNGDSGRERQSDEESLGGEEDGSDESGGSGDGHHWNEDGLGERGYFETAGTYGEDVIDGVKGDARSSSTWILRAQFRRMAAQTEGGTIGLLAERSRRKWRSLGIGSTQPRPQAAMSLRGGPPPALNVVTHAVPAPSSTGVEEEPASAATMKGPMSPLVSDPLSPNPSEHNVEVTLSPPSPKGPPAVLPPLDTTSTPPTTSPRTSQDYHRSGQKSPQSPDGFLRDPPRAYKASQRNPPPHAVPPRARRNPPPPPAPIAVPIFSDLDFSEQGYDYPSPGAPHSSSSGLHDDAVSSSTSALGRLSFSSQRSGERTPTTPQHLLPTSRANSFSSSSNTGGDGHLVRPAPVRPTESSTSISMLNDLAERSTTALVPGRDADEDDVHPLRQHGSDGPGVQVVVMGAEAAAAHETGSGLRRVASPLDSPYEEQAEFSAAPKSPRLV